MPHLDNQDFQQVFDEIKIFVCDSQKNEQRRDGSMENYKRTVGARARQGAARKGINREKETAPFVGAVFLMRWRLLGARAMGTPFDAPQGQRRLMVT